METLHTVLVARRDEVLLRWKSAMRGTLAPEAISSFELVDHIPLFLREVIAALLTDAGMRTSSPPPDESTTAADHGEQRLRLGFSLDTVVREYGVLRDAILTTGREAGASITPREQQIVSDSIVNGIAQAVSEYTRQRDLELQRQHNEHFAFIAHELRNPLSAAMLGLDYLKRAEIAWDAQARASLDRGLRSLRRMQELIDHSLTVARESSGVELRPERVLLRELLEEAASFAASAAEDKKIDIRIRLEQEPTVDLDLRLARSALTNLVTNAVKYSCAGSTVELRGTSAGARAVIEVEDCCGGLPPGKVEEAFAPFVRFHSRQSGFGLGLAIAKQAADAHGGTIRVQNLPGKGCIFALEFPLVSSAAAPEK